ncbi:MFS transporter [Paenibacillus koleovorans]|uniref:MFS transporter n=1 Tax=Paenibacillus koleovorans TaxID=121608 RepID=UPI000FD7C5D2|nr:MFS transporter [Paenibacillus koleovorans]
MIQYTRRLFGNLSPAVQRFIGTEAVFGTGTGIFSLILNLHMLDLGYSQEVVGRIASLGALTVGILSLPAGWVVQRIGRKNTLVFGMGLSFASMIVFAFGTSITALTVAQLIWSLGITAIVNSEIQLLFEYCRSREEEPVAYSLLFAVFTLFVGVGTLLGGYLPIWLPGNTTVYQYAFIAAAICFAAGTALRGWLLPASGEASIAEARIKNTATEKSIPGEPLSKKRGRMTSLLLLSVFIFIAGFATGMLNPFLNVILKFRFLWDDGSISLLLTLAGVFLFVGSMLTPYCLDKWGSRRTIVALFLSNLVFVAVLALAMPALLFSALLLLRGGLFNMLANLLDSEAMSAVEEEDRNLYAGMRTVSRSLGNALASYLAGYIMAGNDYTLPFLITAASLFVGFLLYKAVVQPLLRAEGA